MAVVNTYSDQIANVDRSSPNAKNEADAWSGKLRVAYFTATQVGAGDAASIQYLVKMPAGRVRIIPALSRITNSAFGASRVLDVGHGGYTNKSGTAVPASANYLANDIDVSAAANNAFATTTSADPTYLIESRGGFTIQSVVAGGTIPDAATLKGYIVYIHE